MLLSNFAKSSCIANWFSAASQFCCRSSDKLHTSLFEFAAVGLGKQKNAFVGRCRAPALAVRATACDVRQEARAAVLAVSSALPGLGGDIGAIRPRDNHAGGRAGLLEQRIR